MIKSQYENTTGLSLLESGILLDRELTNRVLVATVLGLALKEQFTIKRTANDSTGAIDIELFRNGSFGDQSTLDSNEKLLLGIMFKNFRDDRIHFSDMMELTTHLPFDARASIRDDIIHRLAQKGLFGRGGLHITAFNGIFFARAFIASIFVLFAIYIPWYVFPLWKEGFLMLFYLPLTFTILFLLLAYIAVREMITSLHITIEGKEAISVLRGYREYLLVAEKDRIDFHESLDAETRMLTKHLPYAVLFGVEQAWLKKISGQQK